MFGFCLSIVQSSFSTIFYSPTTTTHSPPLWMPCACHVTAVSNGDGNTDPHLLLDHTATPNDEDEPTHHLTVTDMATATSTITPSGNSNLCCHPLSGCPLLPCHGNGDGRTDPHPLLLDDTATTNNKDETICHITVMDLYSHITTLSLSAVPHLPHHSAQLN